MFAKATDHPFYPAWVVFFDGILESNVLPILGAVYPSAGCQFFNLS